LEGRRVPAEPKEPILLLTTLPQDLRSALAAGYELVDHRLMDGPRPGFRIAVTTAMAGADAAMMDTLPDLRMIASQGTGLDRLDLPAAARRGVSVAYTPDLMTEDVADFAIGLMYAAARRIAEADRFVRAGRWMRERMAPSIRLHGKTLGIVGLGRIGQALARRGVGIGMQVAWTGPRAKLEAPWRYLPTLVELASVADVLILCPPGGAETQGMVDATVLEALGPRGILVNIARGSVVEEPALLAALETGGIAAAGLDVFAAEPALDLRFVALENVVLAPHYASLTQETRAALVARILDDIAAFREGRPFLDAAAEAARDMRP
jgi:lactate dehydrogenase-like 2-hydroxyacid dehydrogenase